MEDIGTNAGKVWKFLKEKGPNPISNVGRGVGLKRTSLDQAIGWLAREDKIQITKGTPNRHLVSLK